MSDRCEYIDEPGLGRIFIPGCMGASINGRAGCTCPRNHDEPSDRAYRDAEIDELEQQLAELQQELRRVPAQLAQARREGIEAAAALVDVDADWTAFARASRPDWTPAQDPETEPTEANVRAYRHGLLVAQVIAAAIRREAMREPGSQP